MMERVARAIATADEQNGGPPYDHRVQHKHARQALFDEARAAIEAMREPTEDMEDVGRGNNFGRYANAAWEAMIDAALASERKP